MIFCIVQKRWLGFLCVSLEKRIGGQGKGRGVGSWRKYPRMGKNRSRRRLNIHPEACCRQGWGERSDASPSPLPPSYIFSSCSVNILLKDDGTVILLLGVSFLVWGIPPPPHQHSIPCLYSHISLFFLNSPWVWDWREKGWVGAPSMWLFTSWLRSLKCDNAVG
jgi:hypothetical protein